MAAEDREGDEEEDEEDEEEEGVHHLSCLVYAGDGVRSDTCTAGCMPAELL